jgi:hypothetical protein
MLSHHWDTLAAMSSISVPTVGRLPPNSGHSSPAAGKTIRGKKGGLPPGETLWHAVNHCTAYPTILGKRHWYGHEPTSPDQQNINVSELMFY